MPNMYSTLFLKLLRYVFYANVYQFDSMKYGAVFRPPAVTSRGRKSLYYG